jgi:hypothetical protein
MKRAVIAAAVIVGGCAFASGTVGAAPAEPAPVQFSPGVEGAHPHHVFTGNGGCVDINSVYFEPDATRGLHGASFASTITRGPWHGPCA